MTTYERNWLLWAIFAVIFIVWLATSVEIPAGSPYAEPTRMYEAIAVDPIPEATP